MSVSKSIVTILLPVCHSSVNECFDPYVVIIYDSLPTAPNLGSLTFSYSSLPCGSDDPARWSLPISVSLKPIDLTALKAEESRFWDVGDFPPWVQGFESERDILGYRVNQTVECLRFTYIEARIVD